MSSDLPLSELQGDRILVRGHDLADLIGRLSFTEMLLLDLHGTIPSQAHVRMVDAILVALMEHGLTPSTLGARLILDGAPESMQGAVAAGLLAVGSRFLGTIEGAASLLQTVAQSTAEPSELAARADRQVADILRRGERIPGLGHNLHGRLDPRVAVLIELARKEGVAGIHVQVLKEVEAAAQRRLGRPLIVNAAGAGAAVLSDLGYPVDQVRGFALVARCAGLFAHVVDERRRPRARGIWESANSEAGACPTIGGEE